MKHAADAPKLSKKRQTTTDRSTQIWFYREDWHTLWEDFSNSLDKTGKYLYPGIRSFARAKTKIKAHQRFLHWYLGPANEHTAQSEWSSWCALGPQDWVARRRSGGWYCSENLRAFGAEIRRRMNALEALREAGNGVTLNSLVRTGQLAQELDNSFKGRMFIDSLSFEENVIRTQTYIKLHEQILGLQATAQELYAKSHGVNFDDMAGLAQLMQAAALNGAIKGDDATEREKAALTAFAKMAVQKSQRYALEVPEGVIDAVAEAVETVDKTAAKKRGVN